MKIIYEILCIKNNKRYIGQTSNFKARVKNHKRELRENRHGNKYLQADYNKYGLSYFKFNILEYSDDINFLKRETFYMNKYGGTNSDNIYNVRGNFHDDNIEYAKSKVKHCEGHFDLFRNHKHTDESKLKISNSLKAAYKEGRKVPNFKGAFGEKNSFYGKHHTEKTRKILSEKRTKYTEQDIQKLRELYNIHKSYKIIGEITGIHKQVCSLLINYGTSSIPKVKKMKKLKKL